MARSSHANGLEGPVPLLDYHLHLHDHGESGPYSIELVREFVDSGAQRGVTEFGFTEHIFRFREIADLLGEWWKDEPDSNLRAYCEKYVAKHATQSLDDYVEVLTSSKNAGLPVKLGLEVDYYPGLMDDLGHLLSGYPLDFRLGSVHWLGGWGFDDPATIDVWAGRDVGAVWSQYFDALCELVESGTIDVIAHPDLVKKFGHRPGTEPLADYERVALLASSRGIAFEVSSAGLRKPVAEAYPSARFLECIRSAGAAITTASDAHVPEDAGADFDRIRELALAAGFGATVSYSERVPTEVLL